MTTIVYDHKAKQIACDSRLTRGYIIVSDDDNKFTSNKFGTFALSGRTADCEELANNFDGDISNNCGASGFLVCDGVCYWVYQEGGKARSLRLPCSEASGSGEEFALSALDFGKSAKEAVEYAMTRDNNTGGKVRVFDVEKMEFIEG